jgi:hypothetical protein
MKFLNLNAFQTYISAALVAVPMILVGFGCVQAVTGTLDCSGSILSPRVTAWIIGALAVLKFGILPATQPGGWFRNLFEPKVPVSTSAAPGTVMPHDVVK